MNVFVTFGGLSWQKGSDAQLVSLVSVARSIRHDIDFVLESHAFDLDVPRAREIGIGIVGHTGLVKRGPQRGSLRLLGVHAALIAWAAFNRLGYDCAPLVRNSVAQSLLAADLVVDLSGDSYRDRPGGFALAHTFFLLSALWCGKPVAIVSQSLGPFKWYSRWVTRYCLNKAVRVYTREQKTIDLLHTLGVDPGRISLAPDVAFCLSPTSTESVRRFLPDEHRHQDRRPVVGISVSCLMRDLSNRRGYDYMQKMSRIVAWLRETHGARVLLIPHVVTPPGWGCDDVGVAKELAGMLQDQREVWVVDGDPNAAELKAVISGCDLFLGARMHAAIAALSSHVPTIMLSWSHKYSGLMDQIGLKRFVWNFDSSVEELETLIQEIWQMRVAISGRLRSYTELAQRLVRSEISQLLEERERQIATLAPRSRPGRRPASAVAVRARTATKVPALRRRRTAPRPPNPVLITET